MSSKERIFATIEHKKTDYIPINFSGICHGVLGFLNKRGYDDFKKAQFFIDLEVDHGISCVPPVNSESGYKIKQWREEPNKNEKFPVLYKEYITPKGSLRQVVRKTEDYLENSIRLINDHHVPPSRSKEYLVSKEEDLEKLIYILKAPEGEELDEYYKMAKEYKNFAEKKGIIFSGYALGVGDPLMWFSGVERTLFAAMENPDFLARYIEIVSNWNYNRIKIMIEAGVDLIIRRGWYESTDFWSPELYKQFLFKPLKREIDLAHGAGVKFCYCMNSGVMPLLEIFRELKFDILSNIDPTNANLDVIKAKIGKEITLCGGVNNFRVLECGTEREVEKAVIEAKEKLSPGGGYIMAPGDSILATTKVAERNFYKMIEVWKKIRYY